MAALQRRRWHFYGRVQGVGFRYRAQYAATGLGLTGWVLNEDDGSVLLEAQGPEEQLDQFVPTLTATSRWIMIEDSTMKNIPVKQDERGFHVRGY